VRWQLATLEKTVPGVQSHLLGAIVALWQRSVSIEDLLLLAVQLFPQRTLVLFGADENRALALV